MHGVQFSAACAVAVVAVVAGFGCATGVSGSVMDESNDAGDEQATNFYDSSPGPSYDSTAVDSGTGQGDDTSPFGQDSSASTDDGSNANGGDSAADDTGTGAADTGAIDTGAGAIDTGPPPTGLSVLYQVGPSAAMSAYIGCQLSVTNASTASVPVSSLEARYYFIGEDTGGVAVTPQMTIQWSHVSTSGANADLTVTYTFNPLQPATTTADTYVAFDFSSSHSELAPGESAVFSWQVQGPDPAQDVYNQTSDYSFNASMTSLAPWTHVTLFQGGSIAWGAVP
jgi:Cellulose binding domain